MRVLLDTHAFIWWDLGKLDFVKPLEDMIAEPQRANNIEILPVRLAHALVVDASCHPNKYSEWGKERIRKLAAQNSFFSPFAVLSLLR